MNNEYWKNEMAKAEEAHRNAKTKAAVKKANARMMECRMAMREPMNCGGYEK